MNIQHQSDGRRGSFFVEQDSARIAEMVYVMAGPKRMIIEHTEVDESLKGKGAGVKMLEALVDFVRKEGVKVIPLCPFAKATFEKRPDLQDVLN
ncbi:N-acetyltransferase [Algoriphagus aestuariicola]|jgi:predicted GNAT family acetyltransferase|uniref:N-acetyltransferase n=1 Tax=Algoriphagus aestuariicola TaxID=1852016 RepID=A0ABS3BPB4_9BACT|nr:GNAT family N-acetyltransferase [Algoriphagus aestuariicola]MBN7801147.1 N-acetyltransferase [Algoriphagus aestuariicola]